VNGLLYVGRGNALIHDEGQVLVHGGVAGHRLDDVSLRDLLQQQFYVQLRSEDGPFCADLQRFRDERVNFAQDAQLAFAHEQARRPARTVGWVLARFNSPRLHAQRLQQFFQDALEVEKVIRGRPIFVRPMSLLAPPCQHHREAA